MNKHRVLEDTDGYSYAIGVKLNNPMPKDKAIVTATEDPNVLRYVANDTIQYRRKSDREYHRVDGPALINIISGVKMWYLGGKCHCTTGPAIEDPELGHVEWYLHGVRLDPKASVDSDVLKMLYPLLVASMFIYLVHEV